MDDREKALAVGHIPSGLFVVCTKDGEQKEGYLASWVQQVSFSPLMIAVACKEGRPGYERIMAGEVFTVNIVGKHHMDYLKHFWSGYGPEDNPFGEIEHTISENGGIIFSEAKSCVECRMVSKQTPGDHDIVFAEVIGSYELNPAADVKVHIRKSGMDY